VRVVQATAYQAQTEIFLYLGQQFMPRVEVVQHHFRRQDFLVRQVVAAQVQIPILAVLQFLGKVLLVAQETRTVLLMALAAAAVVQVLLVLTAELQEVQEAQERYHLSPDQLMAAAVEAVEAVLLVLVALGVQAVVVRVLEAVRVQREQQTLEAVVVAV
jgi:hypothetical protein